MQQMMVSYFMHEVFLLKFSVYPQLQGVAYIYNFYQNKLNNKLLVWT